MAETGSERGGRLSGIIPLVVVLVVVVLFLRSCWREIGPNLGLGQGSTEERDLEAPTEPEDGDDEAPGDGDDLTAVTEPREPACPAEDGSSERHLQWTEPPPMCIDPGADYTATLHTTVGDVEIALDADEAPVTVNNFVFLARWHFYDGVEFHRVFPQVSLQAGDPIGDPPGTGGPGYTFEGEIPEDGMYPLFSVFMGNAGTPDTSSSVFLIVTGTEAQREPIYARFGRVTDPESQQVVETIDETGHPRRPEDPDPVTVIESVTIEGG